MVLFLNQTSSVLGRKKGKLQRHDTHVEQSERKGNFPHLLSAVVTFFNIANKGSTMLRNHKPSL
jgi:hypothetical protein